MRRKSFDIEENQAEDDGRTIADMSDVPGGMMSGGWHPAKGASPREKKYLAGSPQEDSPARPWEDHSLTRKERFMFILGTLKATMLIGLAYLVGLGLLIGLMVVAWKH